MTQIIYFYDALCGWCYGFSPVIKQLYIKYSSEIDFQVVSGGMIMGHRVGPIGKVAGYITHAYRTVENRTGVTFGQPFLEVLAEGSQLFSSEKPGIALTIVKELSPENAIPFAHDIQHALYYEGRDLNDADQYIHLLERYNIDKPDFRDKFISEEYQLKTLTEFELVRKAGISGFPTLVFKQEQSYELLCQGYQDFLKLDAEIERLLNKDPYSN